MPFFLVSTGSTKRNRWFSCRLVFLFVAQCLQSVPPDIKYPAKKNDLVLDLFVLGSGIGGEFSSSNTSSSSSSSSSSRSSSSCLGGGGVRVGVGVGVVVVVLVVVVVVVVGGRDYPNFHRVNPN